MSIGVLCKRKGLTFPLANLEFFDVDGHGQGAVTKSESRVRVTVTLNDTSILWKALALIIQLFIC